MADSDRRLVPTDALDIEVLAGGPDGGRPVLLLHGWPDAASTWDGVAGVLHRAGFRTVAPSLRGFGATRFKHAETPRTGNSAILAMDAIALMDALGIGAFSVAGHDWGSNIAEALVVGWPDRVRHAAFLATVPRIGGMPTPPFWQAQLQWYHWFMATDRGAVAVRKDPKGFARVMWENWAPQGWFDNATFDAVARAWENPDFVDVTLHSYRSRWGFAAPDPASAWLQEKIASTKTLSLPALYLQGEVDGVNPPRASEHVAAKFSGPFERIVMPGIGHFPTREAPEGVGELLAGLFSR